MISSQRKAYKSFWDFSFNRCLRPFQFATQLVISNIARHSHSFANSIHTLLSLIFGEFSSSRQSFFEVFVENYKPNCLIGCLWCGSPRIQVSCWDIFKRKYLVDPFRPPQRWNLLIIKSKVGLNISEEPQSFDTIDPIATRWTTERIRLNK